MSLTFDVVSLDCKSLICKRFLGVGWVYPEAGKGAFRR